jgi:hypothetical protein
MKLQEQINRIQSMMGIILESKNDDIIKSILFKILKNSEYVKKFDYLWSPNLSMGADIIFVDLDENDFFNKNKSVFDIIEELWPYGDYKKWKDLYYGLVYGYKIKDKNSDVSILIQIIRYENEEEFDFYINPNYIGQKDSEKTFIDDKIVNVFGLDDDETIIENDFSEMGEKLIQETKSLDDYKLIFKYLDAVI